MQPLNARDLGNALLAALGDAARDPDRTGDDDAGATWIAVVHPNLNQPFSIGTVRYDIDSGLILLEASE
jgi:hypothetical protein